MWNATVAIYYCMEKFNRTDLQESCYIDQGALGHQEMPKMKVFGTVIYSIIFCTGVFGNVSTCIVIRKHRILRTSTNVYLFNLAVADLITLVTGIPFEVYMVWRPYPWDFPSIFCHLKGWFSEATSYGSVLTILAFSFERYVAVCHSFSFIKFSNYRKRLKIVLTVVWLMAGVCAAPFGIFYQVDYAISVSPFSPLGLPLKQSKVCAPAFAFDFTSIYMFHMLFHVSAGMFFVIPMVILFWMYTKVFLAVRLSKQTVFKNSKRHSVTSRGAGKSAHDYHSRKVLIILVAVVSGFFACYAPFQVQRLMFIYVKPEIQVEINHYLFWISGFLFYFSATLNPIMYNLISPRYRRAFVEILCCTARETTSKFNSVGRMTLCRASTRIRNKIILLPQEDSPKIHLRNGVHQNITPANMILLDSMAKYDIVL